MAEPTPWGPGWIAAGLRARRRDVERDRRMLRERRSVPADVRDRGVAALTAIIAAIDAEIAQLEREAQEMRRDG